MKQYLIPPSVSLADRNAAIELIVEAGGSHKSLGLAILVTAPEEVAEALGLKEVKYG